MRTAHLAHLAEGAVRARCALDPRRVTRSWKPRGRQPRGGANGCVVRRESYLGPRGVTVTLMTPRRLHARARPDARIGSEAPRTFRRHSGTRRAVTERGQRHGEHRHGHASVRQLPNQVPGCATSAGS